MKDRFRKAGGVGILLLCILAYLAYTNVIEKRVILARDYPANQEIHLPLIYSDGVEQSYAFYVQLFQPRFASKSWRIVASGCIEYIAINYKKVDLSRYSRSVLCDLRNGRNFNFADLTSGTNNLSVMVENPGATYTVNVTPNPDRHQLISLGLLPLLIIIVWSYFIYKYFRDKIIVLITSIALYLRYLALIYSNFTDRSPDWWGHIEYVRYMALYFNIPDLTKGWQFYHPPLYYYITGAIYRIADILNYDPVFTVRIFSFICILIFQYYGLKIITAYTRAPILKYALITFLSFQVLMPILGGRISNEVFVYVIFAAFYFYLLEWNKNKTRESFNICLMLCAIGFLVKTSVIILVLTLAATYIYFILKQTIPLHYALNKRTLLCVACAFLALGSSFSRTIFMKFYDTPEIDIIVANHHMDDMTKFERIYSNWDSFRFSYRALIQTPNFNIFLDNTGRQNFWSSYVKSFSFAGYKGAYPEIMTIINLLTFGFVISLFLITSVKILNYSFKIAWVTFRTVSLKASHLQESIAKISIAQSSISSVLIICITVALICHVGFRLAYPVTTTHEARFTFPIIICLLALVGNTFGRNSFTDYKNKYLGHSVLLFFFVYALFSVCYSILFVLKLAAP